MCLQLYLLLPMFLSFVFIWVDQLICVTNLLINLELVLHVEAYRDWILLLHLPCQLKPFGQVSKWQINKYYTWNLVEYISEYTTHCTKYIFNVWGYLPCCLTSKFFSYVFIFFNVMLQIIWWQWRWSTMHMFERVK